MVETDEGTDNLWNDGDVRPKHIQVQRIDWKTVVIDCTFSENAPKERQGKRTLHFIELSTGIL
jgi:hypothetical protein